MIPPPACVASRFAKPRSSLARAACRPDRGKLPACQKVSERETDCYFLRRAKSNIPSPCAGSFEVLQTSIQRTQVAVSHKLIKSLPLRGISSGRRGSAPYLYTQSVCAACFASILRRQSRSMAFPDGNISLLLKKQDKNTGCRPLPVHAKRVQICHASQALSGG